MSQLVFPSSEWVAAWVVAANGNDEFRRAGEGWHGCIAATVLAHDGVLAEPLHLRLDGHEGRWTDHRVASDPGLLDDTVFVLTAGYPVWKRVIRQELNPVRAMVQGQIRVRGRLSVLLDRVSALLIMTRLAATLDTVFADEVR